jgi:hypothetical protein
MYKLFSVIMVIFFIGGCKEDSSTNVGETGELRLFLTDAPAAYDSINITFSEISAHLDSSWITVVTDPITYNLLELNNGTFEVLGAADVPAGHYTQIRIKIAAAEISVNGEVYPLAVPSGAQTGLKLGPEFTIEAGSAYELMVDFDASRSIVTTGPPYNPQSYKLKPHLRVVAVAITGSIFAKVSNPDYLPIAYAIQGTDTVSSAFVDPMDSTFMLTYLSEGAYTVSVRDTLQQSYNLQNVQVTAGETNNLGEISLH